MKIISKKLRNSAKGEQCLINIVGACNYRDETVSLCHLPDESNGMGKKSDDISAAFCCSGCHDAIDRRSFSQEFENHKEFYMRRAMIRTWRRWIQLGLIKIA